MDSTLKTVTFLILFEKKQGRINRRKKKERKKRRRRKKKRKKN